MPTPPHPPPRPGTLPGICNVSVLEVYSPPPSSWSNSYKFFATSFSSVQKPNDTFSQLLWTFSWVYWEKDNGFKTWTINLKLKMKMKKKLFKKLLLDRTLHENTGLNLCFSLYIRSHCIRFHIKNYHYLKLSWRNISALPFQKINSFQVRTMRTFISNFKTLPLNTSFNFDKLFLPKHSPTNSCICLKDR